MSNSQEPAPAGLIPQSQLLAEASEDSLSELFSRDPEGFQRQDRDLIVKALRAQRARFELAEAEGKKAPRQLKAGAGAGAKATSSSTSLDLEDLGL